MEVEKNFYRCCKKQALRSDPGNSALSYPPAATEDIWICVCGRLNRWRGRRPGRNECTAPVPTQCLSLKVFIICTITKRFFKAFFPERVFTKSFHFSLFIFSNLCQAPLRRIQQGSSSQAIFFEKVKYRHVGSNFGHREPKVLKQQGKGKNQFSGQEMLET